jgi:hypothetical protein
VANDVVLVVGSQQRRLRELASRCHRPARGLADPTADLARAAAGQAAAVVTVSELGRRLVDEALAARARRLCAAVDREARRDPIDADALLARVDQLLDVERALADAWSGARLDHRRQWGRAYRRAATGAERALAAASSRSTPSGTELYERARQAKVAQRSRMTVRELQAAVLAAERRPEAS